MHATQIAILAGEPSFISVSRAKINTFGIIQNARRLYHAIFQVTTDIALSVAIQISK